VGLELRHIYRQHWVEGPTDYWDLHQLQVGSGGWVDYALFSYSASDWCYQFRTSGKPYQATHPRDEFVLKRLAEDGRKIGRILIMGRRGDRAFYRIDAECFARGVHRRGRRCAYRRR
jgi:hypothetical protein